MKDKLSSPAAAVCEEITREFHATALSEDSLPGDLDKGYLVALVTSVLAINELTRHHGRVTSEISDLCIRIVGSEKQYAIFTALLKNNGHMGHSGELTNTGRALLLSGMYYLDENTDGVPYVYPRYLTRILTDRLDLESEIIGLIKTKYEHIFSPFEDIN